jgi:hypothetical protein
MEQFWQRELILSGFMEQFRQRELILSGFMEQFRQNHLDHSEQFWLQRPRQKQV